MSDFLDRLAARALGNETTLAPRLPSLFESPRHVPIMPAGEPDEVPSRHQVARSQRVAAQAAAPASSARRSTASEPERGPVAPTEHVAPPPPAPADARSLRETPLPASTAPRRPPTIERPVTPARKSRETDPPAPGQPQRTRVASGRPEAASTPVTGTLLPPSRPVFATPAPAAGAPPLSRPVAARPPFAARADRRREVVREPVVHVSIGRLEVRAVAGSVAAPRRPDGPHPSSLDDYLRQRGDQVTP